MKIVTPAQAADCGAGFRTGHRYTVFAQEGSVGLETTRCAATTEGEIDPQTFGVRATPVAPPLSPEAAPIRPAAEGEGGPAWWPWVFLGGTVVAAVAFLAMRGRRTRLGRHRV
jgi:hypothetical protein